MIDAINPAMAEALQLTRSGDLMEATRLIQRALGGSGPAPRFPAPKARRASTIVPRLVDAGANTVSRDVGPGFVQRHHREGAATLDYLLYVPAGARPGMPLVVMLHGCTQSPDDFARGTGMNALAEEFGIIVAYPAQASTANAQKCWNWFRPGDQMRGRGEPALIAGMTREVIADLAADPTRVYVAGLSAGGAAAAIMGAAYPDLYAAVGVHSGLACGAARDLPSALAAMRTGGHASEAKGRSFVPTIAFHGDRDATVHAINSRKIVDAAAQSAAAALETRTETHRRPTGRSYTRELRLDRDGKVVIEHWTVHGAGHAWSGGRPAGSYTDPTGPDASRGMLRFFLSHGLAAASN